MQRLIGGADLSQDEAAATIGEIMDGAFTDAQSAALLAAIAGKGESTDELIGAARAMRNRSLHVNHDLPLVLDVVGTGGDGAETLNVSTLAALAVAAAGVPVAKHGNRAASSACGSADVLEACGMTITIEPDRASDMLRDVGFTFMFAQRYHPAMKKVASIRRELGVRTIFNLLGPLTNPASATHQMVGVARESQLEPVANALGALGVKAAAVVHAESGMDEVAGEGPTAVFQFGEAGSKRWVLHPEEIGVHCSIAQLRGGSVPNCRDAFESILSGEQSARTDVVALNAGLALMVCGKAATVKAGFEMARSLFHDGSVQRVFERAARYSHG